MPKAEASQVCISTPDAILCAAAAKLRVFESTPLAAESCKASAGCLVIAELQHGFANRGGRGTVSKDLDVVQRTLRRGASQDSWRKGWRHNSASAANCS